MSRKAARAAAGKAAWTPARRNSNKRRKDDKEEGASDPDKIRRDLDRYRDEMAEDAPASDSPEDNP